MDDHESIPAFGRSGTEPPARARANAKISVRNSEAMPYDQTVGPVCWRFI